MYLHTAINKFLTTEHMYNSANKNKNKVFTNQMVPFYKLLRAFSH